MYVKTIIEKNMTNKNIDLAVAYYTAMGKKDISGASIHLHSGIHLISPLAELIGKETVLEAIKGFIASFRTIHIRVKLSNEDNAMLIIDVDYPAPIGLLRTASLLTIQNSLITRIELFHDARRFERNNDKILA